MTDRTFSLGAVVAAASVSFVISGLGGAVLSEWLARPKPLVTISAVGFAGSEAQVQISDALIKVTDDSAWTRNYRKFESFSSIEEDYATTDRIKKRLERGLALVDGWLAANSALFETGLSRLTIEQVDASPYMSDDIVGSALIGMARRGELQGAPLPMSEVIGVDPVTEIVNDGSKWLLYFRNHNIAFPFKEAQTETEKSAIKLLAHSFAYGAGANIVHYLKRFQAETNRELRELILLKEQMAKAMLPLTKLSVTSSVFNSGRSPLVIKPYALLRVLNDDVEPKEHVVKVEMAAASDRQPTLLDLVNKRDGAGGDDVVVDSFLPKTLGSGYVLVPPNGKVDVKLTSVEPLGSAGERLRAIYDSNVLRCQVTMLRVDGVELTSDALLFGSSVDADLRVELLQLH